MDMQKNKQLAEKIFRDIQNAFPYLKMEIQMELPHLDANMD